MLLALLFLHLSLVAFATQAPNTSDSDLPIDRDSLPISSLHYTPIEERSSSFEETHRNSSKNSQNPQIFIQKDSQIEGAPNNCSNTSQKLQISSPKNSQKPQTSSQKNSQKPDQDSEDSTGSTCEDGISSRKISQKPRKNSQKPQISSRKKSQKPQISSRKKSQKPQISTRKKSEIKYLKKNQSRGDQDSEDSNNESSTSEDGSRLRRVLRFLMGEDGSRLRQFLMGAFAILGLMVVNRFFWRPTGRNATNTAESRTGTSRTIPTTDTTTNGPPATVFSYVVRLLDAHPNFCRLCLLMALYFWPRNDWWWGFIVWIMLFQFQSAGGS